MKKDQTKAAPPTPEQPATDKRQSPAEDGKNVLRSGEVAKFTR